jgi:hypothetical protein
MTSLRQAWADRWPHYCRTCEGWGIIQWDENQAPLGSGHRWMETITEACDVCLGSGKCPRCGHEEAFDSASEETCPYCEWDLNGDAGMPPEDLDYEQVEGN